MTAAAAQRQCFSQNPVHWPTTRQTPEYSLFIYFSLAGGG
jgi:hypothetical protein